jgi:hypothetical protein
MVYNYSKPCIAVLIVISFFLNSCDSQKQSKDIESILGRTQNYGTVPEFSGTTDANVKMICPKLNAVKSSIVAKHTSDSIRFLSVTVDPETDTPETLKRHRQEMKFTDKRWTFIRMDNDSILERFMNGLMIGYAEQPQNHSARIILIDSKSHIRGYFDALDTQQVDSLESILRNMQ